MTTPETNPDQSEATQQLIACFKKEQNLLVALLAGLAAAVVGAIIWAAVTVTTEYQIGWMAVGVGFLVGFAVRLGKGIDKTFGILGAVLALFGCILGNFFTIVGFVSAKEEINLFQTLASIDYAKIPEILVSAASPMDFLFYAIAVYEGYKFSFRKVSETDIASAQQKIAQGL